MCSKWNYYFWPKNDGDKWSRKNICDIPPCAKPFSDLQIYFIKGRIFALNYIFSNKNDLVFIWRDFKKILWCICISMYDK